MSIEREPPPASVLLAILLALAVTGAALCAGLVMLWGTMQ